MKVTNGGPTNGTTDGTQPQSPARTAQEMSSPVPTPSSANGPAGPPACPPARPSVGTTYEPCTGDSPPPVPTHVTDNSLVIFSRAAAMLAEADTIQKTKELKSLALTAADWARHKGMGEEAIQHCRSYALEAERKMGEILLETERAKGAADGTPGPGRGKNVVTSCNRVSEPPTLSALGLTKRESAEAQRLATLPPDVFEAVRNGAKTRTQVKRELKRSQAESEAAQAHEPVKVPEDKREAVIKTAITTAQAAGSPITAKDIQVAASPATESELNSQHSFPKATRSSKAAWTWWYFNAKPDKRGVFFGMLLTSDKPVEVDDKNKFTDRVMRWLAENVSQKGGTPSD